MVTALVGIPATEAREKAMLRPEPALGPLPPVEVDTGGLAQEYNALIDSAYMSQMGGDYQRAIDYYTKAIDLDPQIAGVYVNRAAAYESIGDPDQALQDLDKALAIESKPEAYHNRGNIRFIKGDYDRAIQDYNKALELVPATRQLSTTAVTATSTSQTMPTRSETTRRHWTWNPKMPIPTSTSA